MNTTHGFQSQPSAPPKCRETSHLRTQRIPALARARIMRAHEGAFLYPYSHSTACLKQTAGLALGTQTKLLAAAFAAYETGNAINTLLTVRWATLLIHDDFHPLRTMTTPERIQHLVELLRKWLTRRDITATYLWVREFSDMAGEHWHLALHLPKSKRQALAGYLSSVLVEPLAPCPRAKSKQTRGEFACSELASWHLAGEVPDDKPQFPGYWIAAYLGKGEPSQRMFRGKLVDNKMKPVRGREFGGAVEGGRYDVTQGNITGTTTRKGRFNVARYLK